ncbi:fasciclin domain-containing protein, partial [Cellulomonas rhizosphaerae]
MKILRFAAVGVAAALALTACSSGDDTPSETTKPSTGETSAA